MVPMTQPSCSPPAGDDITLSVRISNAGPMLRSVDGRVVGCSVHYTGRPLRSFLSLQFSGTVSPGQSEPSPLVTRSTSLVPSPSLYGRVEGLGT